MLGGRADIVDAERKMVVAPSPQIRRMLAWVVRRLWIELEQLDLEVRLGSFEYKRDVLSAHVRHTHVPRRRATIDHRDVLLPEAKELEELDRGLGVRHCDGYMIGVANYQHHPSTGIVLNPFVGWQQR